MDNVTSDQTIDYEKAITYYQAAVKYIDTTIKGIDAYGHDICGLNSIIDTLSDKKVFVSSELDGIVTQLETLVSDLGKLRSKIQTRISVLQNKKND